MALRFLRTALLATAISFVPATGAFAASGNTSTATGTVNAAVVAPIVLTHTNGSALNFGKFTVSTGGTVVVTAAGVGSTTGAVNFVPGGSGVAADAFTVTGDTSRNFSTATTATTITNGTKTIAVATTPSAANATTTAAGTYSFTVGGTLTITGTETPGSYTGTYSATVTYN